MGRKLALLAIRLLVSVNLLYAAVFLKFAGVPGSVTLFTQMSQTVHGLISQPVFRLGACPRIDFFWADPRREGAV